VCLGKLEAIPRLSACRCSCPTAERVRGLHEPDLVPMPTYAA
jgi:hypothetical protein